MKPWRELANRYRSVPLRHVLTQLGAEQDALDTQKWLTPSRQVWLGKNESAEKFYDHINCVGGGGAIDLVQYALGVGFKEAVAWLDEKFSGEPLVDAHAASTATSPCLPIFYPPKPAPEYLGQVIEYVTGPRKLPAELVEKNITAGKVYADARRNVVFLCEYDGEITGAELRGTCGMPFKAMAAGSRRGYGFFTLPHPSPTQLVIVESAIDAFSYRALHPKQAAWIISTAGVMTHCPRLLVLANKIEVDEIVIAYDNDKAGEAAAENLSTSISAGGLTVRCYLPQAKDWNDALREQTLGEWAA